ncbi:hypothetical protein N7447_001192 [Penicillium robsamsonii]|uniref:uncharacterized protein n=1 Tax=Penicillium robsamsonii TaxID=1792511 RepID=UPI0025484C77|nr:uncharacterized protein N7447_001192 [Penicillium robsamsonii]KAJ5835166.1 hypothetical protein N7447_001192 [Penicillium robsamsonii]
MAPSLGLERKVSSPKWQRIGNWLHRRFARASQGYTVSVTDGHSPDSKIKDQALRGNGSVN